MRFLSFVKIGFLAAVSAVALGAPRAHAAPATDPYVHAPMPPGFQVIVTELEGPVFADAQGHTLYSWPKLGLRSGNAGEIPFKPTCDDQVYRETSGFVTPYPAGLELPEVDHRPSCAAIFPPVLATADSKNVGKWVVTDRLDGRKQWTYDGWSLYTSVLDKRPGDVNGGTELRLTNAFADSGVPRLPVKPDPNVPPQFMITTTMKGIIVTVKDGWSIYTYDGDGRNKSNCYDACVDGWEPVIAGEYTHPVGEWTTFERLPGVHQWAFRGMPVYRHLGDQKNRSQDGSDVPRWHNVYLQLAPPPPKGFVLKQTLMGVVLGDSRGMTVYKYHCADDAVDQQDCDHPDAPQAYRFAICGGDDPDRCVKTFPYVIAPVGAQSGNQLWSTMYIDPKTGKRAAANQPGVLNVWAFRARPVYTFAGRDGYGDKAPEDTKAQAWGVYWGMRNGYRAFVYRDLFLNLDEQ